MKAEEMRAEYAAAHQHDVEAVPFSDVTVPKVDQGGPLGAGEFTYVDISSVDNKLKRITEYKTLAAEAAPSRAKQRLKTGDVLISMTRPNLNAVAIVPPELDGAVGSTGFHVLRATEGTEPRWLYYAVQTKDFIAAMSELVQGALYPAVRPKDIRAYEIPHPPIDQQKRIVAEIEKQFSRLDEAAANLKRVKANLKRYKAAVLKAAVEGRLVETEADRARREGRGFETGAQLLQRILETRRSQWQGKGKYKEPAAPDTTDLPELPEGWVWGTFGHLCQIQGGYAFKSGNYQPHGVPLVRISNLVNGSVQVKEDTVFLPKEFLEEFVGFRLQKGDTLIAMSGATTGKMATFNLNSPALLNQRVGRFRPTVLSLIVPGYISLLAMQASGKVLADAYGAAQPNISPTEIEAMPVGVPPLVEQHRIVAEVDRRLSLLRETEAQVDANLQRAERLRQSILSRAYSGGLAVSKVA